MIHGLGLGQTGSNYRADILSDMRKLIKNKCEIEDCKETKNLQLHHIIQRTDLKTNNHPLNLCILCPNHHNLIHSGELKIIGVYPSTKPPNGRTVVYELNGVKNVDIDIPFVVFKPQSYKLFNGVEDELQDKCSGSKEFKQ